MSATELHHVGIWAWIIQDGNYADFEVGQDARFALEFYAPEGLQPARPTSLSAEHLGANRYRVRATVVFRGDNVWVIDTGRFVAFWQASPPSHAVVGAWVEGTLELSIDPFFYFESLHSLPGMPMISYRWAIRLILREMSPWVVENGVRRRDRAHESFIGVNGTNAWSDDQGHAHYVLIAERLSGPESPIR